MANLFFFRAKSTKWHRKLLWRLEINAVSLFLIEEKKTGIDKRKVHKQMDRKPNKRLIK